MSKSKTRPLILGISLLLIVSLLLWIAGTKSSTSELPTRFASDASFRGQIAVTIIERKTGPERHLKFLVDLDRGEISAFPNAQPFSGSLSPGGHLDDPDCERTMDIPAPDHELAAYCRAESGRYSVGIRNLKSRARIREWPAGKGWGISGLIWSADSKSMAALLAQERTDLGPVGLLSAASGHPIPLVTFRVTLLSNRLEQQVALPAIRKYSPSGWARLDWIQ